MFCIKCGGQIDDDSVFCSECGTLTQNNARRGNDTTFGRRQPGAIDKPYPNLSDKWAWSLACAPIIWSILLTIISKFIYISNTSFIPLIIPFVVNCVFFLLDLNELKHNGLDANKWIWTGFLLIPVYMFMRAAKTNKQYGYAILWCALFAVSIFM
jgi:hypothetical protein